MFFFVINKDSNWEILTKNLVTFKGWNGVKDEKSWRLRQFANLGGAWQKRGGWCFWEGGGVMIPQCTLCSKLTANAGSHIL